MNIQFPALIIGYWILVIHYSSFISSLRQDHEIKNPGSFLPGSFMRFKIRSLHYFHQRNGTR